MTLKMLWYFTIVGLITDKKNALGAIRQLYFSTLKEHCLAAVRHETL